MRRTIAIIGWIIVILSLLLSLSIFLPAPTFLLWGASLVASEWSIWLIVASIVGGTLAIVGTTRSLQTRLVPIPIVLATTLASLAPVVAAFRSAPRFGVTLSLPRYLFGSTLPRTDVEKGIEFAHPEGTSLKLDLYRPQGHECGVDSALPAVVVIHGGAWSAGFRSDLPQFDNWLAGTGRVVIDIDYRLASATTKFPAQVEDLLCALAWVRRNAAHYCIDTGRVVLLGRSAGGELALVAANAANDPRIGSSCDAPVGIRAVIAYYAPTDLSWGYDHPVTPDVIDARGTLELYLGGTPLTAPAMYALASPMAHFDPGYPPTLLIHGGHDQIVSPEHALRADQKLAALGVPHKLIYLPWANHGFDLHVEGLGNQIAQHAILEFLEYYAR